MEREKGEVSESQTLVRAASATAVAELDDLSSERTHQPTVLFPDWERRRGDGQGSGGQQATAEEFAYLFAKAEGIWGEGNVSRIRLKNLVTLCGHLSWVDAAIGECREALEKGRPVRWGLLTSIIEDYRKQGGPKPPPAEPEPFISEVPEPPSIEQLVTEAREREARREAERQRRRELRAAWEALPRRERNRRIKAVRDEYPWARTSDRIADAMAYLAFAEAQPQPPEVPSGETH